MTDEARAAVEEKVRSAYAKAGLEVAEVTGIGGGTIQVKIKKDGEDTGIRAFAVSEGLVWGLDEQLTVNVVSP